MIVCAAIKITFIDKNDNYKVETVLGHRHGNCFHFIHDYIKRDIKEKIEEVQGFITDKNDFLDRIAARKHFIDCNQGIPEFPDELYSEDLY